MLLKCKKTPKQLLIFRYEVVLWIDSGLAFTIVIWHFVAGKFTAPYGLKSNY